MRGLSAASSTSDVLTPTLPAVSTAAMFQVDPSHAAYLRSPFVESEYEMRGWPARSSASDADAPTLLVMPSRVSKLHVPLADRDACPRQPPCMKEARCTVPCASTAIETAFEWLAPASAISLVQ